MSCGLKHDSAKHDSPPFTRLQSHNPVGCPASGMVFCQIRHHDKLTLKACSFFKVQEFVYFFAPLPPIKSSKWTSFTNICINNVGNVPLIKFLKTSRFDEVAKASCHIAKKGRFELLPIRVPRLSGLSRFFNQQNKK